jgi:hypothetical protein
MRLCVATMVKNAVCMAVSPSRLVPIPARPSNKLRLTDRLCDRSRPLRSPAATCNFGVPICRPHPSQVRGPLHVRGESGLFFATDLGDMTSAEDYRQLAAQEAELAKAAVTNESRSQHYAMAAYYTRLAVAKEKLANARR